MIHFERLTTDPFPIIDRTDDLGPRSLREWVASPDGPILEYAIDAIYTTIGLCELLMITPSEIERRAMALGWIYRTETGLHSSTDAPLGFYREGDDDDRARSIADAFWQAEAIDDLVK